MAEMLKCTESEWKDSSVCVYCLVCTAIAVCRVGLSDSSSYANIQALDGGLGRFWERAGEALADALEHIGCRHGALVVLKRLESTSEPQPSRTTGQYTSSENKSVAGQWPTTLHASPTIRRARRAAVGSHQTPLSHCRHETSSEKRDPTFIDSAPQGSTIVMTERTCAHSWTRRQMSRSRP